MGDRLWTGKPSRYVTTHLAQLTTVLGGLTIHPQVENFLQCTCAKNYANWLAVDKVIAKTKRVPVFLKHSVDAFC